MTIVSKENIPIMTSAMNSNEHSSSATQALLESTEKSGLVKEGIATNDVVTMESVPADTNFLETMNLVEELVSKKRVLTDTLATTNKDPNSKKERNEDVGADHQNINEDNDNEESPATMTETSVNATADDQQCEQDVRDNSNIPLQSSSIATTNTITSADMTQPEEPIIDLQRPVKRARTAYFLFLDDYRSTIQKENPGASVAIIARILGQRWSAMSDDDKQPYHERALMERQRVTAATEAWKKAAIAAGKNIHITTKKDTDRARDTSNTNDVGVPSFVLPVGRVRKICRLDPDVRGISKEALLLITKVTEMVTIQLGEECIKTAHIQNRRTLLPQDIVDVCNIRESFFFLKDDITDLHRQQQKLQKAKQQQNGNTSQRKGNHHGGTSIGTTSKSMTDYFKPVT